MTHTDSLFGPTGSALFSDDGVYRYVLGRRWADPGPMVVFVMLNPSTADAETDDRTIAKCVKFARRDGYAALHVLNLFALRSTFPTMLLTHPDPVGPDNDRHLDRHARAGFDMVAAWGGHTGAVQKVARARAADVVDRLGWVRWRCLGTTKDGDPRHPLYLADATQFVDWPTR